MTIEAILILLEYFQIVIETVCSVSPTLELDGTTTFDYTCEQVATLQLIQDPTIGTWAEGLYD